VDQHGVILTGELEAASLSRSLPYRIYLPPCYAEDPEAQYPTLYLLHGLARTDSQWDDLGVDEKADSLIASGSAPPFLIVMPWERKGLDFEAAIVEALVPFVDGTFRTRPQKAWRAIGGVSRGAGWALRIGLKHPDTFGAIGLHSPAVLTPDLFYVPGWVESIPPESVPRLWIDIGDRDSLRFSTYKLRELLDELGLKYSWRMDPGEHTEQYWAAHVEHYLRWYTETWDLESPGAR
jgi:enterochelin esterase-like enzyme